jgi:glycosyltransferase involved in cell wall biosynthesis
VRTGETPRVSLDSSRPLVSIVTVVFNGAAHLEKTITSVVDQSYDRIEYIVLDGGSTDGSVDIIRKYESRIAFWASRSDSGMYYAMNEGIERSHGEIVGIINSDDWYEPKAIERVVDAYLASDRQSVIYGSMRYFDADRFDMILSYDHRKLPSRMINHPSCFVPRTLYDRYGRFDTRYRIAADYDLLLRLFRNDVGFVHLDGILSNFRHGGYSMAHSSVPEVLAIRMNYGYIGRGQYLLRRVMSTVRRAITRRSA